MEAPGGFEPPIEILQTSALPLGDGALLGCKDGKMEREKGFEPSTSTLARLHSTTELLPQEIENNRGIGRDGQHDSADDSFVDSEKGCRFTRRQPASPYDPGKDRVAAA